MIFPIALLLVTVICADVGNNEWEPLLEQLEQLGDGNHDAVNKAKAILLKEARRLDMPLPSNSKPGIRGADMTAAPSTGGVNSEFAALIKTELISILRKSNHNVHSGALTIDLSRICDLSKTENLDMSNLLSVADEIKAGLTRMNSALDDLFNPPKKTEEGNAAADAVEKDDRKRGQGEIHFDGDSLRFEWSMLESRFKELPESTQKVWRNLDNLSTNIIAPETRRMFEGHAIGFYDPAETNSRYRKISQKMIKRIVAKDLFVREQFSNPKEHDIIVNQTNGTYIGTNKQGQFTSDTSNYTGEVSLDLTPQGVGVLTDKNRTYKGSFDKGLPSGEGVAYYNNDQCVYVGSWKNGVRHGLGTLSCDCGYFMGTWMDDSFAPIEEDHLYSYHSDGCNISWKGSPVTSEAYCNGSLLADKNVTTNAFTGILSPKLSFSTTSCPLVSQPVHLVPKDECFIREDVLNYTGQCNGGYATGKGDVSISTKLFTAKLTLNVSNKVMKGRANGTINGNRFIGTISSTPFSNVRNLRAEGVLTSNEYIYRGKLMSGKFHGAGTLTYPSLNTSYKGVFSSNRLHGVFNQSSTTNSSYEIAAYRHGTRHGQCRTYVDGVLTESRQYSFGEIVGGTPPSVWTMVSKFITDTVLSLVW